MAFTNQQLDNLKAPLAQSAVKSRSQAGRSLSYIEGWHAIAEANRIFGFDAWDRETVELRQLGDPREIDGKWRIAYMARVRVTVRAWDPGAFQGRDIVRDGCGYGSGIDRDLGQAHESALKEAETDAMKRALMTFGNPFGLALYDKDQRNVADDRQEAPRRPVAAAQASKPAGSALAPVQPAEGAAGHLIELIRSARSERDLQAVTNAVPNVKLYESLDDDDAARVSNAIQDHRLTLKARLVSVG